MKSKSKCSYRFVHWIDNLSYPSKPFFGLLVLIVVLFAGCTAYINNVKSANELNDKKLLAGRIVFFEEDTEKIPKTDKLKVWINKQGDDKAKVLKPNEQGYVYIPVDAGQYNMANYTVAAVGNFLFKLPKFPCIQVYGSDSAVNFGTIEIRFHQGTGSKVANLFFGGGRGYIKVNHLREYDGVQSILETKVGMAASSIRNEIPAFLNRVK